MRRGAFYLLLSCWLCACAVPTVEPVPTATTTPVPPTSTWTPSPSPDPTSTATIVPTPTLTPEPTETPLGSLELVGGDVVVRQTGPNENIIAIGPDGSTTDLSQGFMDKPFLSALSPDGEWVVIGNDIGGKKVRHWNSLFWEIWLVKTDGTVHEMLFVGTFQSTPLAGRDGGTQTYYQGGWSADSRHLILNCPLGASIDGICFVSIDGLVPRLIQTGYEGYRPTPSPDQRWFVFWRFTGRAGSVMLVDPQTLQPRSIAVLPALDSSDFGLTTLIWSADSESLNAFVAGFRRTGIYNVRRSDGAVSLIADLDGYASGESLSLDRSRIAMFLKPDGKVFPELIVMNFDGSDMTRIETQDRLKNANPGNAGGFEGWTQWTLDGRLQVASIEVVDDVPTNHFWNVDLEAQTFTQIQ